MRHGYSITVIHEAIPFDAATLLKNEANDWQSGAGYNQLEYLMEALRGKKAWADYADEKKTIATLCPSAGPMSWYQQQNKYITTQHKNKLEAYSHETSTEGGQLHKDLSSLNMWDALVVFIEDSRDSLGPIFRTEKRGGGRCPQHGRDVNDVIESLRKARSGGDTGHTPTRGIISMVTTPNHIPTTASVVMVFVFKSLLVL